MNLTLTLLAAGLMALLGLTLSAVLAVANRKLYVYRDPRIEQVEAMLPGVNCGACGLPGCPAFAQAIVDGGTSPGKCTVASEERRSEIAEFLGVDVGGEEKSVARLACAGGTHVARQRGRYTGVETCRAANLVAGGGKGCSWGCLGFGDCMVVCTFNAITMDSYRIPIVDDAQCTACGDCVEICPKQLFELHPVSHRLWVACKNLAFGDEAENECEVACNACGKCAADAPAGVVQIVENLARVDFRVNDQTSLKIIQRCPTGAIVWLGGRELPLKGAQAKHIVRHDPLPIG